jgi:hypothetical protein
MKYIKLFENFENIDWDWKDEEESDISMPDVFKDDEDFYKFLVDNNALDKYIYNFDNYKEINYSELLHKNKNQYILWSFDWSNTPEGHEFWSNLNYKWINFLHTNNILENKNENKFKIGEYAIWKPFNNERVKILDITNNRTIWIQDKHGNIGEWLIKDFIPEFDYLQKNYNI